MSRRQLFLSRRVVTEEEIIDGGVLVDENGVIEKVLKRDEARKLAAEGDGKIKVVDGGDLALMAGVVDSHVHVNEPGRTAWEGFRTATNAAAAGGITTIVDMPLNSIPPTTTVENLKTKASSAKNNVYVDVGFWGGVIPGNQHSLRDLVKAGVVGFKCFLCPSGVEEFPNVELRDLEKAFEALEGTGSLLAFHAEIDDENTSHEPKQKKKDPKEYQTYLESRPPDMELNAISLITSCLEKTDVRVHVVHVSSAEVVPLLERARKVRMATGHGAWRGGVTAETCHHYLSLSADQIPRGHSEYKCAPPIRDKDNKEELWKYLLDDKLDLVVSDHSPCTPDLKCSNNLEAWGGISSVQFGLSLFWTEASSRGLDLKTVSKYLSSGPAQLCGLQDRKGALKAGLDADFIFYDSDASFTVTTDIIRYKNKLSPYLNKTLKGVVKETYLRGQLVYADGDVVGEPKGKLLLNNF
ncbi:allantoinase isoform X2 [Pectinophora gossypiella]|uniref:allantoinase isoform X2 n=1 Tax=Pectinophora gossypiella TaxID=13191 RepID=UPI00214F482D|nr:allantoinase isoform X2 [Pectinophora gossypiella]